MNEYKIIDGDPLKVEKRSTWNTEKISPDLEYKFISADAEIPIATGMTFFVRGSPQIVIAASADEKVVYIQDLRENPGVHTKLLASFKKATEAETKPPSTSLNDYLAQGNGSNNNQITHTLSEGEINLTIQTALEAYEEEFIRTKIKEAPSELKDKARKSKVPAIDKVKVILNLAETRRRELGDNKIGFLHHAIKYLREAVKEASKEEEYAVKYKLAIWLLEVGKADEIKEAKEVLEDIYKNSQDPALLMQIGLDFETHELKGKGDTNLAGAGISTNYTKPFFWFKQAAAHNYIPAYVKLIPYYQNCKGFNPKHEFPEIKIKKIEDKGEIEKEVEIEELEFETIAGEKEDYEEYKSEVFNASRNLALGILEKVKKSANAEMIHELAYLYERFFNPFLQKFTSEIQAVGDDETARQLYEIGDELGFAPSTGRLAAMLLLGIGGALDIERALEKIEALNDRDTDGEALYNLGMILGSVQHYKNVQLSEALSKKELSLGGLHEECLRKAGQKNHLVAKQMLDSPDFRPLPMLPMQVEMLKSMSLQNENEKAVSEASEIPVILVSISLPVDPALTFNAPSVLKKSTDQTENQEVDVFQILRDKVIERKRAMEDSGSLSFSQSFSSMGSSMKKSSLGISLFGMKSSMSASGLFTMKTDVTEKEGEKELNKVYAPTNHQSDFYQTIHKKAQELASKKDDDQDVTKAEESDRALMKEKQEITKAGRDLILQIASTFETNPESSNSSMKETLLAYFDAGAKDYFLYPQGADIPKEKNPPSNRDGDLLTLMTNFKNYLQELKGEMEQVKHLAPKSAHAISAAKRIEAKLEKVKGFASQTFAELDNFARFYADVHKAKTILENEKDRSNTVNVLLNRDIHKLSENLKTIKSRLKTIRDLIGEYEEIVKKGYLAIKTANPNKQEIRDMKEFLKMDPAKEAGLHDLEVVKLDIEDKFARAANGVPEDSSDESDESDESDKSEWD